MGACKLAALSRLVEAAMTNIMTGMRVMDPPIVKYSAR